MTEPNRPRLTVVRGTPEIDALLKVNDTLRPLGLEIRREDLIDNFIKLVPDPVSIARRGLAGAQRELRRLNAVATSYEVDALRRPILKWKQRRAGDWRRASIRQAAYVEHCMVLLRAARAESRERKLRIVS